MLKLRFLSVILLALLLAGCHLIPHDKGMETAPVTQPPVLQQETEAGAEQEELTEAPTEASKEAPTEAPTTVPTTAPTEPPEEHFLLSFVGDCTLGCHTLHTNMGYGFLKVVGDDYKYPFQNVVSYFENDDLTFANLEGTLNNDASPAPGKPFNFRGPEDYVNILTQNSVEVVSVSNNHAMDYGQEGYDATTRVLRDAGVQYVERDSSTLFTTDRGLTVGLYAVMYYHVDEAAMVTAIEELAQQADIVIFAPHWGIEGSFYANEIQIRQAHKAIDAGAHNVWGHHPHVLQRMEKYNDGIICYSMGNFCFGGNMYPKDFDTAIVQMEVIKDGQGTRVGEISVIPCSMSSMEVRNNFQPTPYPEDSKEYARTITKLDGSWRGSNLTVSN